MNYLLTAFTGLGNFVLASPIIHTIHKFDKNAKIDVIGNNRNGSLEVIKGSSLIRNIYKVPTKIKLADAVRAFSWINRNKYDVIFFLFSSSTVWLQCVSYVSNCKLVVQHINLKHLNKLDRLKLILRPKKFKFVPILQGRHEINLNLDLFESFYNKPIKRNYQTLVSLERNPKIREKYKIPGEYICLQPGSNSGGESPKRWPIEYFSRLIELIQEKYPTKSLVIVGDKGEYEKFIKPILSKHPNLINTAGITTINDLKNILSEAKLVIAHDSGVMHLANALGTNLIALYGPTDYTRTSPLGKNSFVIKKDIPCSPCMYNFNILEKIASKKCPKPPCMYSIKPKEVMNKICKILEGR